MGEPVILVGQSLVDNIVEVLVVGEDDVTADIVQLSGALSATSLARAAAAVIAKYHYTYEAFVGNIGTSETTGLISGVDNQP